MVSSAAVRLGFNEFLHQTSCRLQKPSTIPKDMCEQTCSQSYRVRCGYQPIDDGVHKRLRPKDPTDASWRKDSNILHCCGGDGVELHADWYGPDDRQGLRRRDQNMDRAREKSNRKRLPE